MFLHLSVPKVLILFSTLPCRHISYFQIRSLAYQILLPVSTNFEIFPFLFFFLLFFFFSSFFQADTIPTFSQVALLRTWPYQLTSNEILHWIPNINFFSNSIMVFIFLSSASLRSPQKIRFHRNKFNPKFLPMVSVPYITALFAIELYISNLFLLFKLYSGGNKI